MRRSIVMALFTLCILALAGIAEATTQFSITGISFNPASDNNGLKWSASPLSVADFTLAPGDSKTFDYGSFYFKKNDTVDTDNFTASMTVTPPGDSQSATATVDGSVLLRSSWADVTFQNAVKDIEFGNGGEYKLTFNSLTGIADGDTEKLTATICLLSDPVADPAPVPEPGTMMLLGTGFLGLAVYGKRRRAA